MKTPLLLSIFFILFSASYAGTTPLTIFEQKDFGQSFLPAFDAAVITMDCNASTINVFIKEDKVPVKDAIVRIMYSDYSTPLLASGVTDANGKFSHKLVGNKNYMRGVFLAFIEKAGYKNKEVHFDIAPCIQTQATPKKKPPPSSTPSPPEQNESNVTSGNNSYINNTNHANATISGNNSNTSLANFSGFGNISNTISSMGGTAIAVLCCGSVFLIACLFGVIFLVFIVLKKQKATPAEEKEIIDSGYSCLSSSESTRSYTKKLEKDEILLKYSSNKKVKIFAMSIPNPTTQRFEIKRIGPKQQGLVDKLGAGATALLADSNIFSVKANEKLELIAVVSQSKSETISALLDKMEKVMFSLKKYLIGLD